MTIYSIVHFRAIATGTAGTAMAIQLFDKIANKFKQILFLLLDLPHSMYRIHISTAWVGEVLQRVFTCSLVRLT